ncbi:MAG: anhydro-N-acetylmuramic acid kinase [Polaromonas sp.]|nr:anhydro-N-acetylmuramic acid kinase [Polaromonas sp.]
MSVFIGLMSGTSLDGVDGVLLSMSGEAPRVAHACHLDMPEALRQTLLTLNSSGPDELHKGALAANALAQLYAQAVHSLLRTAGLSAAQISAIGAHGQTVRHQPGTPGQTASTHRPWHAYTLQLNNPALLAELTGITVVADFRSRDVAAGGQGAPLVPAFHHAVFAETHKNVAVVNIGGMANVTLMSANGHTTGFDTGPGNVLMDLWAEQHLGQRYDAHGAWAASGQTSNELLTAMQQDAFFQISGPRSTGRDHFHAEWLQAKLRGHAPLPPADVQATLCELSVWSIVRTLTPPIDKLVVCGGGVFNRALMAGLSNRLPNTPVVASDVLGIPAMEVEAAAFAWLASQTLRGHAGNLTQVTGAAAPRILGAIYPA